MTAKTNEALKASESGRGETSLDFCPSHRRRWTGTLKGRQPGLDKFQPDAIGEVMGSALTMSD
jgi:hypothetical protein